MNFQTFKANVAESGSFNRGDVVFGAVGLWLGGPVGAVLSPLAFRGFNKSLKAWALAGVAATIPAQAAFWVPVGTIAALTNSSAPVEEVAEAPAAPAELPICSTTPTYSMAPSAPCRPAPVAPTYEYPTRQAALTEMCEAGKEYLGHVLAGRATVEQGKEEVRSYSTYLSRNSPASKNDLLMTGMGCSRLWKF